jgi:hypothetical protein
MGSEAPLAIQIQIPFIQSARNIPIKYGQGSSAMSFNRSALRFAVGCAFKFVMGDSTVFESSRCTLLIRVATRDPSLRLLRT